MIGAVALSRFPAVSDRSPGIETGLTPSSFPYPHDHRSFSAASDRAWVPGMSAFHREECDADHHPRNRRAVLAATAAAAEPRQAASVEGITADGLLGHIKVLASDEFEGRGPGTPGEEKTVAYLTEQFRKLGLKPGNPDGTLRPERAPGRVPGALGRRARSGSAGGRST